MKNYCIFLLAVWLNLAAIRPIYAQVSLYALPEATYDLDTVFISRMKHIFAPLDKSKIPYGLLLDYAMEFALLPNFNGVLSDTNKVNPGILNDIYNTLSMSIIRSNSNWTHPEKWDSLWAVQRQAGVLTLCGLYYHYARFRDNALSSNLVTVSNEQIYDRYVSGVWKNPYKTEKLFALSPSTNSYRGLSFQVVLPSNLWKSNRAAYISSILIDFGNGAGYKTIQFGQLLTVTYSSGGTKVWKFKLNLTDGTSLYSHSEVEVTDPNNTTAAKGGDKTAQRFLAGAIPFTADEAYKSQVARGWATIDYADAGRVLDCPLIVAEGFDSERIFRPEDIFGDTDIQSFIRQINFGGSGNLQNLLQNDNQQYDIVYVDWARGTDYIQRNALLLETVIRWVNANKVGAEPNVVLGQSMGGLVARWALRDMELKGQNHQTRLFISYDSPHLGANVPLAYQHAARHANSLYVNSLIPQALDIYNAVVRLSVNTSIRLANELAGLWGADPLGELPTFNSATALAGLNLMDTPAARQMLIYRINRSHQLDNSLHTAWQQELKTMAYPLQSRNVAVSNGSECGFDQGFAPYSTLLEINGKINTRILGDIVGGLVFPVVGVITLKPQFLLGILNGRNELKIELLCKAQPENSSNQLYKMKITYTKKVLWLITVNTTITNRSYNANPSVLPIDNTPAAGMTPRLIWMMLPDKIFLSNTIFKKADNLISILSLRPVLWMSGGEM